MNDMAVPFPHLIDLTFHSKGYYWDDYQAAPMVRTLSEMIHKLLQHDNLRENEKAGAVRCSLTDIEDMSTMHTRLNHCFS